MPTTFLTLHWGTLALRGAVAVMAGLIAFFMPAATLFALTLLFGAYAVVAGVVSLSAVVTGALQIGAVVLALWMGAYIFIFGVLMLSLAFRLRHWNAATLHPRHA